MTPDELERLYQASDSVQSMPALDGLDGVNWSAVEDAYGPATAVPALLRALVSNDPVHREFAVYLLCQTLWHSGTVYPATAEAVPFLFRLLEADGPQDRQAIVHLLALVAEGVPPFLRCEHDPSEAATWRPILERQGRSLDAEIAMGKALAAKIRHQLVRRLDLFRDHLEAGFDDPIEEEDRTYLHELVARLVDGGSIA